MAKEVWVAVALVGRREAEPAADDLHTSLEWAGVKVTSKFQLLADPNERDFTGPYDPNKTGNDWAEFTVSQVTDVRPNINENIIITTSPFLQQKQKWTRIFVSEDVAVPSDGLPGDGTSSPDEGNVTPIDPGGSPGTNNPGDTGDSGSNPDPDPSSGSSGGIPKGQIDAGVDQFKKGVKAFLSSKYGIGSKYADAVDKTEKLGSLLYNHTAKQMGLVKDAIDGKIDSKQLFKESDTAARKLVSDAFKLTDLPKEAKDAVKNVTKVIDIQKTAEGAASAAYDYVTGGDASDSGNSDGQFDNKIILRGRTQDDQDPTTQGNQFVFSGDGRDFVKGSGMGEHVSSGGGNDYFEWTASGFSYGQGYETAIFNGGTGSDTLDRKSNMHSIIDLDDPKSYDDLGGGGYAQIADGYFRMRLIGVENALGDKGNDRISGSAGRNALSGRNGNDTLKGRADNDKLNGGAGADKLYGGDGSKGVGNDIFIFTRLSDSTLEKAGRDTIFDFEHGDRIDLSEVDANGKAKGAPDFVFIATKAFSGKAGEVRFEKKASDTYVYVNANNDKQADMAIHLDDAVKLVKADFIL